VSQPPSFWLETCGDDLTPRPPLPGDLQVDVAIVGAGYTGLWTAHHLLRHEPTLRVAIIEREIAGWGASGRNGGWCSALFPTPLARIRDEFGPDAAKRLTTALEHTVDDIGAWCEEHDVDAHFAKGGTLTLARGSAQAMRLQDPDNHGAGEWLAAATATERVAATNVEGASFSSHCAAIQPARLVRGLARVVESQGATIYEQTAATAVELGRVTTANGTVTAETVVRATEGYTADLRATHRLLAPIWSLIIATEPIDDATWAAIGWRQRETLADDRHLIIYAQRTADGRVVFGGRGAPYRFGSATTGTHRHTRTYDALERALHELLPQTRDVAITHRWGGVIGVPRDWMPSVTLDPTRQLGFAGGYVGDGVGCSALAGRTLADLVLGRDTDRTHLPWVNHRWRKWEPEPFRWAGITAMTALMASADAAEARTGRPARRAALLARLTG
jgi:glycine/D-amino acid oxidase-like deaminating enzyme